MIIIHILKNISTNASIWAIIAAIAATFSAIAAIRNSIVSSKALALSKKIYVDRQANFNLYLINSYRIKTGNKSNDCFLLFYVTITNISDSKSSFRVELEIEYIKENERSIRVKVFHEENSLIPKEKFPAFTNDIRIEERAKMSRWLIFRQPLMNSNVYRILKYTVKVIDVFDNEKTLEILILKEFNNEAEKS